MLLIESTRGGSSYLYCWMYLKLCRAHRLGLISTSSVWKHPVRHTDSRGPLTVTLQHRSSTSQMNYILENHKNVLWSSEPNFLVWDTTPQSAPAWHITRRIGSERGPSAVLRPVHHQSVTKSRKEPPHRLCQTFQYVINGFNLCILHWNARNNGNKKTGKMTTKR